MSAKLLIDLRLGARAAVLTLLALVANHALAAQATGVADRLVSSWILVSVEKQAGSGAPVRFSIT